MCALFCVSSAHALTTYVCIIGLHRSHRHGQEVHRTTRQNVLASCYGLQFEVHCVMQQADYTLGLGLSPRGRELLESGWINPFTKSYFRIIGRQHLFQTDPQKNQDGLEFYSSSSSNRKVWRNSDGQHRKPQTERTLRMWEDVQTMQNNRAP